jgi:hypothetical protein
LTPIRSIFLESLSDFVRTGKNIAARILKAVGVVFFGIIIVFLVIGSQLNIHLVYLVGYPLVGIAVFILWTRWKKKSRR